MYQQFNIGDIVVPVQGEYEKVDLSLLQTAVVTLVRDDYIQLMVLEGKIVIGKHAYKNPTEFGTKIIAFKHLNEEGDFDWF